MLLADTAVMLLWLAARAPGALLEDQLRWLSEAALKLFLRYKLRLRAYEAGLRFASCLAALGEWNDARDELEQVRQQVEDECTPQRELLHRAAARNLALLAQLGVPGAQPDLSI